MYPKHPTYLLLLLPSQKGGSHWLKARWAELIHEEGAGESQGAELTREWGMAGLDGLS